MDDIRQAAKRFCYALCSIDKAYYLTEKKKRLSDAELCMMYTLDDGEQHSQIEIAEKWSVPKTTINAITNRWKENGLITQTPIPGKCRELGIRLTPSGREYVKGYLLYLYGAEEYALRKTLERYSDTFIEALEFFAGSLKEGLEKQARGGTDL